MNFRGKIGVLGGSFDPAHKGHLAISKEAKKILKLKKVIWAITEKNPLKNNKDLFQLFKIKEDINHINNKEFSYRDDINYLRELLMFENLTSNPSKVDNKKYLDRLLLI